MEDDSSESPSSSAAPKQPFYFGPYRRSQDFSSSGEAGGIGLDLFRSLAAGTTANSSNGSGFPSSSGHKVKASGYPVPFLANRVISSRPMDRGTRVSENSSERSSPIAMANVEEIFDKYKDKLGDSSRSSSSTTTSQVVTNKTVDLLLDRIQTADMSKSVGSSDFKTPLPVLKNKSRFGGSKKTGASVSFSGVKEKTAHPSSTPKYNLTSSGRLSSVGCGSSSSSSSSKQTSVIVALSEGRGVAKGEVGVASFDLRHPELVLAQFADTAGYSKLRVKIQILNPVEIIVPDTVTTQGGNMVALVELLQEDFPKVQITTVPRRYFSTEKGKEDVSRLRVPECSSVLKDIEEKYYCLASVAALVKYVEHIQNIILAAGSIRITYKGVEKTCMIDPISVKHLELIVSLKNITNAEASLNGILNSTCTGSGARMLRASILQPPADLDTIQIRLDAIDELLADEEGFRSLKSLVSTLIDVDQLISLCVHLHREETIRIAEYKLTQVICLKHSLDLVDNLRDALGGFQSELFRVYRDQILRDVRLKGIVEKIHAIFGDEVHCEKGALNMRTQKCFAIKAGLNGLLDIARRTYTELLTDVNEATELISKESGLPFRTSFTIARGFHLTLPCKNNPLKPSRIKLPDTCIFPVKGKASITCTTRDLVKLNDRINQSVNEIFLMSNVVVTELLTTIREDIGCLYNLTEAIAVMDMIISIANYCSLTECVRPEFTDTMAVKKGRHPLLESLGSGEDVVANDTYAGPESSFIIITGPNMAGKSTYLKQVALLQVMAQAGCFVPAQYASFPICDQIFTRIGHNDDLSKENSAFMVEMRDMAYILSNTTSKSLVIMDELGRATATEEAIGIAHSICEELIAIKAIVFFATHFLELMDLDSLYPCVDNYHFDPQTMTSKDGEREELFLDHSLKKGPYRGPLYGLEFAEVALLPQKVLDDARILAERLREAKINSSRAVNKRDKAQFRLGHKLIQAAKYLEGDEETAIKYMKKLKKNFLAECGQG